MTTRQVGFVDPQMLKEPLPRAVVEATADTEQALNFARAQSATVDAQQRVRDAATALTEAEETDRNAVERAALDGTTAPSKRSAPAARSKLDDATARLQATTALLERCRREWLRAAQPVLTEVGQTLDERRSVLLDQAETAIRQADQLIRTAGDLGMQRSWITGVEYTGTVVEYQPSSGRVNMPRNALTLLTDAVKDIGTFRRTETQRVAEAAERRRLEDEQPTRKPQPDRRRTLVGNYEVLEPEPSR